MLKIDSPDMEQSINFQHFFSLRVDSPNSQSAVKSSKVMYAELFGLSRKAVDFSLKADKQQELTRLLKTFIYDAQSENIQEYDINNPAVVRHKGRPPKRLKSSVEIASSQGKRVLKDSVRANIMGDNIATKEDGTRGKKCSKCKQH